MPTYRSRGDRFLGRWKQGEGEIEGESVCPEEKRKQRCWVVLFHRDLHLLVNLPQWPNIPDSPWWLLLLRLATLARGQDPHLCEQQWKETSTDYISVSRRGRGRGRGRGGCRLERNKRVGVGSSQAGFSVPTDESGFDGF